MEEIWCCSPEKHEQNKTVELIFDEVRSIFRYILENMPEDKQAEYALSFFQKMGKFNDITQLAEKILDARKYLKLNEVKKEVAEEDEEKTDAEKRADLLGGMFEVISTTSKSGVGSKTEMVDKTWSSTGGGDAFVTI